MKTTSKSQKKIEEIHDISPGPDHSVVLLSLWLPLSLAVHMVADTYLPIPGTRLASAPKTMQLKHGTCTENACNKAQQPAEDGGNITSMHSAPRSI